MHIYPISLTISLNMTHVYGMELHSFMIHSVYRCEVMAWKTKTFSDSILFCWSRSHRQLIFFFMFFCREGLILDEEPLSVYFSYIDILVR